MARVAGDVGFVQVRKNITVRAPTIVYSQRRKRNQKSILMKIGGAFAQTTRVTDRLKSSERAIEHTMRERSEQMRREAARRQAVETELEQAKVIV